MVISEVEKVEVKDRFIQSAFVGFQLGAGGKDTFGQYLAELGLADKDTPSPEGIMTDTELFSQMGIKVRKVQKQ